MMSLILTISMASFFGILQSSVSELADSFVSLPDPVFRNYKTKDQLLPNGWKREGRSGVRGPIGRIRREITFPMMDCLSCDDGFLPNCVNELVQYNFTDPAQWTTWPRYLTQVICWQGCHIRGKYTSSGALREFYRDCGEADDYLALWGVNFPTNDTFACKRWKTNDGTRALHCRCRKPLCNAVATKTQLESLPVDQYPDEVWFGYEPPVPATTVSTSTTTTGILPTTSAETSTDTTTSTGDTSTITTTSQTIATSETSIATTAVPTTTEISTVMATTTLPVTTETSTTLPPMPEVVTELLTTLPTLTSTEASTTSESTTPAVIAETSTETLLSTTSEAGAVTSDALPMSTEAPALSPNTSVTDFAAEAELLTANPGPITNNVPYVHETIFFTEESESISLISTEPSISVITSEMSPSHIQNVHNRMWLPSVDETAVSFENATTMTLTTSLPTSQTTKQISTAHHRTTEGIEDDDEDEIPVILIKRPSPRYVLIPAYNQGRPLPQIQTTQSPNQNQCFSLGLLRFCWKFPFIFRG